MSSMRLRSWNEAGLGDVAERALSGAGCSADDLERLRAADLLLIASLADAVREKFHGDDVQVFSSAAGLRDAGGVLVDLVAEANGATGAELLVTLALVRLRTPAERSLGLSFEVLGLELAQTALLFGADALCGDLGSKRTLPLLDGPEARRQELHGLIERAGRTVRFVDGPAARPEQEQPS